MTANYCHKCDALLECPCDMEMSSRHESLSRQQGPAGIVSAAYGGPASDGGGVLDARTVERGVEPSTHGGASTDHEACPPGVAPSKGELTPTGKPGQFILDPTPEQAERLKVLMSDPLTEEPLLRKANAKRCRLMARFFRDNYPYGPAPDIVSWFEGLAVDFELGSIGS